MKYLILLLFTPLITKGQKADDKGYIGIDFHLDKPFSTRSPIFGGVVSGNVQMGAEPFYLGAGVGVAKIPQSEGLLIPVTLRLTGVIGRLKAISPIFLITPGYNIYSGQISNIYGGSAIKQNGGFHLAVGGGVRLSGKDKGASFLTLGYSLYSFNTTYSSGATSSYKSQIESLQLRLGVMIN
jgi:hypothetical protein